MPAEICGCSAGATAFLVVLFGVFTIGVFPIFSCFHESSIIIGADEFQCLLVFGVFVAGMVEEGLDSLAGLVLPIVPTRDVASGQAVFLHFALCPAQIPGAVQVSRFAALTGLLILPAGLAVGATAADFLCTIHRKEFSSER